MSEFSYQIPTLREIEESLERTWDVIRESEKLSRKQLMSSRVICNRCHLCCHNGCSKVPTFSRPLGSEFKIKPNPTIQGLHNKNFNLAEENRELNRKIEVLSRRPDAYMNESSKNDGKKGLADWRVKTRIIDLEEKVNRIEKEYESSLGKSGQSTNVSEGFYSLSKEMDRAESRFKKLAEKIDAAEKKLKQPKDRHCARCIPSYKSLN